MLDLPLDDELRATVFARLQLLRLLYGDRIPSTELSEKVEFRGERVPIWNYQKGIFKPAVLGRDGAALTVQTSAESPYEDAHDPDAGHFVYKYRGTDPNQRDNVALRNAMKWQRPIAYLLATDRGFYDAIFPVYVQGDVQEDTQFLLVADSATAVAGDSASSLAALRREYVTRAVMVRLHQKQFRRVVLKAYRDRCSICRLTHLDLLDAAHILRDKHVKGEPIVPNGIGLCKIHHSAFDARILGIDPDAKVHIRKDILEEIDGPMLKHGLQELHGAHLALPYKSEDQPNREYLEERFAAFVAA